MSLLKANAVQLGQSVTATNNFTWYQPATPDGTVRLGNGNSGSVTDLVTLTSAGNLGIGTTSPGAKLSTISSVGSIAAIFSDNTNYTLAIKQTAGQNRGLLTGTAGSSLGLGANNTEYVVLDTSGNLGLGVTPSGWSGFKALQLSTVGSLASYDFGGGNTQTILSTNAYYDGTGYKYLTSTGAAAQYKQTDRSHVWYSAPSGTAGNAISFTQAMTLDANGKLLVGTTTAVSGYTIAIGDGTGPAGIYAKCNGSGVVYAGIDPVNQANNGFYIGHLSSTSQLQMRCGSTGGVYLSAGGTSWGSLSDERLKTDLKPIKNATQKVSTLRAVTGRYKTDDEGVSRSFLIAQDVQSVFPEAVNAENPEELGVRYTDTIPLLVAAIKELSAELNELKQKVNA